MDAELASPDGEAGGESEEDTEQEYLQAVAPGRVANTEPARRSRAAPAKPRGRGRGQSRGRACKATTERKAPDKKPARVTKGAQTRRASRRQQPLDPLKGPAVAPEAPVGAGEGGHPEQEEQRMVAAGGPDVARRALAAVGDDSGLGEQPQQKRPPGRSRKRRLIMEEDRSASPPQEAAPHRDANASGGAASQRSALVQASRASVPYSQAPLDKMIVPGSADEAWVRNHPLFKQIAHCGYPHPFGEREILALKSYTPKQYGGDAELTFY
mmetsp:Transcript_65922/g.132364  ORF Transcript_65922/g.132364 Transcript_65922/m.132364 type:complete len:269 (+) Transcript_65922:86-892(+)